MVETYCGYVNGFIKQMLILMLCLMVMYCTPCVLHGHFTAVPSMAALSQRMPATIMTTVVLRATIYNTTTFKWQRAAQKMCAQVYGCSLYIMCAQVYGCALYIQVGFERNTKGNVKYLTCVSH